jgi:hypothetical protein
MGSGDMGSAGWMTSSVVLQLALIGPSTPDASQKRVRCVTSAAEV